MFQLENSLADEKRIINFLSQIGINLMEEETVDKKEDLYTIYDVVNHPVINETFIGKNTGFEFKKVVVDDKVHYMTLDGSPIKLTEDLMNDVFKKKETDIMVSYEDAHNAFLKGKKIALDYEDRSFTFDPTKLRTTDFVVPFDSALTGVWYILN
ncbi:hypothetical protein [Oceanobacillus profundus]|uniref:Uncharacterized protein n=1 Tax=Oceanobacillus profundus TaxID=372463 RepID=A0A417YGH3_9BACI|nr:hypothetical protein [Oceanobacillus profundus]MBR2246100.1 hypothetical protein [Bacilli bacterium]MBR3119771.1 hypothetical protein [Oceanobacillus sp.]RHW31920.1 hypothetical protein D1B32_11825 [Oceanobacillus profundus]